MFCICEGFRFAVGVHINRSFMYPLCIENKQQRVRVLRGRFNEHTLTLGNPYSKPKPTTAVEHFLPSSKHTPNGPRGNTFL